MREVAEHIALHTRLGNDFRNWVHTAQTLFAGSTILNRERERARAELLVAGGGPVRAPIEMLTLWTEVMLLAFGVECLIKAIWLKQGNELARNGEYIPMRKNEGHRLVQLCHVAAIPLNASEEDALERLSIIARTIGRYPIPRRANETLPRKFYSSTGSPLIWGTDDDNVIANFVLRLKTELRRRGK